MAWEKLKHIWVNHSWYWAMIRKQNNAMWITRLLYAVTQTSPQIKHSERNLPTFAKLDKNRGSVSHLTLILKFLPLMTTTWWQWKLLWMGEQYRHSNFCFEDSVQFCSPLTQTVTSSPLIFGCIHCPRTFLSSQLKIYPFENKIFGVFFQFYCRLIFDS